MNSQDVLNVFLILGLFVVTSCVVYVSYYFVSALKSITILVEKLDEVTQSIKDKVAMRALAAIPALLVSLVSKVIKKRRAAGQDSTAQEKKSYDFRAC